MKIQDEEMRAIVAETLAEQHRIQQESIHAIVLKAVASVLASFGIEDDDRKEIRADFQHLRRWRKSVEQAQSYTFNPVSANNFIRAGYRLFEPSAPSAWPHSLYWRKWLR